MKTVTGVLVILATLLPASAQGQSWPSGGRRVRISKWDGTTVTGALARTSGDEVTVLAGVGGAEFTIPLSDIETMERSLGRKRQFGKNFVVALGVTSAAAGILSAAAWKPCTETGFLACMLHPASRGDALAWGLVGGAALGIPIGVIAGLTISKEVWETTGTSGREAPRLSLLPVLGPNPGVAASVSLRAF